MTRRKIMDMAELQEVQSEERVTELAAMQMMRKKRVDLAITAQLVRHRIIVAALNLNLRSHELAHSHLSRGSHVSPAHA